MPRRPRVATGGTGPLYQGRFKSFPVQEDEHFFTVCRYVERNAPRAKLVASAHQWRGNNVWHRVNKSRTVTLAAWPVVPGPHWLEYVNQVETEAELMALCRSTQGGIPSGETVGQQATEKCLGPESTLRLPGRPRRDTTKSRTVPNANGLT